MNDSQNFHMISMTKFRFWQPSYFHKLFLHVHVHIDLQKPLLWIKCTYSIFCMYIKFALHPSVYICQKFPISLFFFLSRNVMVNTLVRRTSSCPAAMLDSYWDHSVQTYSACPYISALPGNQIRHAPISLPWAKAVEKSSLASELAP